MDEPEQDGWPIAAIVIGGAVLAVLLMVGIAVVVLAWSAQRFGEAVAANAGPIAPAPEPVPAVSLRKRACVELADTGSVPDFSKDFTVEFWCLLQPGRGPQYLVGNEAWPAMAPDDLPVPTLCGWVLRTTDARAGGRTWDLTVATMQDGRPQWRSLVTAPQADPPGWQHVALVRDNRRLALYLDGSRVLECDVTGTVFVPGPAPLYLGVRKFAHTDRQVFADFLAFRISGRAVYRDGFVPPVEFRNDAADLVLFDFAHAAQVDRVADRSGHQRHGSLHNGAQWTVVLDRPGFGN